MARRGAAGRSQRGHCRFGEPGISGIRSPRSAGTLVYGSQSRCQDDRFNFGSSQATFMKKYSSPSFSAVPGGETALPAERSLDARAGHSGMSAVSVAGDEPLEQSLRPQALSEFVGQERMKKNLRVFIEAAKARQEPLDHSLFYSP